MMDSILMNQKVGKWNEACRFLKSKQSKLSSEEWTAIEYLADFWRDGNFDADSIADCESLIELLISSDKLHTNDRDIIVWSKEFRGIAKMMYTKDEDTFKQFKEAMRKFVGSHAHNPRVSNLTSQDSSQVNDGLLRQHAQKWVKAYLFLANNSSNLSSEELEALDYLCRIWANDTLTTAQIKSCEILISCMAECDRLHGNNKEIIVQSKELRNITKLYISNGNDVYQKFQRLLLSIFRELQEQEESRSQNERQIQNEQQIHNEQREVGREQYTQSRVTSETNTSRRAETPKKKSKWWVWILLFVFLWAGYEFWYKDYKRDKDAPRTYVYATNLFLRSSKDAESEYNRVGKVPYGAELITYSNANGWADVKYDGETGYVSSDYLLESNDFKLLNGVWGNEEAKEVVMTSKCRMAILDFLKKYGLETGTDGWQIYTKPKEMKPNTVLFPSLNDGYDEFSEFAFILTDNKDKKRKLALYAFEQDETPVIRYMEDAPEKGDIKSVSYSKWNNKYRIVYSGQSTSHNVSNEKANTKPVTTVKAVDIVKVTFANVDNNDNLLSGYGAQLYQNTKYLKAKVDFKRDADTPESFKFQVKIMRADGTMLRGGSSPVNCTFEQEITLTKRSGEFFLSGWGNSEATVYTPGSYTYEIRNDAGRLLYARTLKIETGAGSTKDSELTASSDSDDEYIFATADNMPEFPGGMAALTKFLKNNVRYPAAAQEKGIQGRVVISFVVEKNGSVSSAKVVKSVDALLDREALRVVLAMPKWKPAILKGKQVRCQYTIPINFKM